MTNDNAIVRLLYAILSQKCLKDIDWNKVAANPILQQEITNGHAARMRYSRFKKQIEGTSTVRRPRTPNSPRKMKVEKTKSPKKVKERKESGDAEKIKGEAGVAGSSHHTPVAGTPEAGIQPGNLEGTLVKREPGSSSGSRYASTPLEESPTPSSSFNDGAGDMDDMYASFDMSAGDYMAEPMMAQAVMSQQQYGIGMHLGMTDSFQNMWDQEPIQTEGGVLVKREPRWDQTYRQS